MGDRTGRIAVGVVLALGLIGAVGCTSASDEAAAPATTVAPDAQTGRQLVDEGEPVDGGSLTIGIGPDVGGYHPFASNWTTEGHLVGSTIFETLMRYDDDEEVVPLLAESMEPNEDFTAWTITLRPDIRFHDGSPLDAEALARNLEAALFEGLISISFEGVIDEIEIVDERTVVLHLTRSYAVMDVVMAGLAGYIAAPSMLDDPDGASAPVGTGPFVFDEWRPNESFRVVANPDYWRSDDEGRALPYLDEIEFLFMVEDQTRRNAIQTGAIDLALTTSTDGIRAARDDEALDLVEDSYSEETYVMLNLDRPPFDDPRIREALVLGTDADSIIGVTQDGLALRATSPFAPGTDWAVDDPGYPAMDVERARALVAERQAEIDGPVGFTLTGLADAETIAVLEVLQQQWADLGLEVSLDSLDPVAHIAAITLGDYDAAWFRSYSYHDPLYLYPFFHSRFANGPGTLSTNFSQVQDPELDELLVAGLGEPDLDARRALNEEVVRAINDQHVNVWLFHTPYGLVARDVGGLNPARAIGFANLEPKPWVAGLWRTEEA